MQRGGRLFSAAVTDIRKNATLLERKRSAKALQKSMEAAKAIEEAEAEKKEQERLENEKKEAEAEAEKKKEQERLEKEKKEAEAAAAAKLKAEAEKKKEQERLEKEKKEAEAATAAKLKAKEEAKKKKVEDAQKKKAADATSSGEGTGSTKDGVPCQSVAELRARGTELEAAVKRIQEDKKSLWRQRFREQVPVGTVVPRAAAPAAPPGLTAARAMTAPESRLITEFYRGFWLASTINDSV